MEDIKNPHLEATRRGHIKYCGQANSTTIPNSAPPDRLLHLDDARQMLACIPADDREVWLKIGMALHSEFDDSGFAVWNEWSQGADNYNAADALAVWRSFNPGSVTIASLIHLAKSSGWSPQSVPRALPPIAFTKPPPKPKTSSTAAYAAEIWLASSRDNDYVGTHPYAQEKGIDWAAGAARGMASGRVIGKRADCVIVPIRNVETNRMQGVQCINGDGEKQTFGTLSGGGLVLGSILDRTCPWYVCEGWASAVSMVFHHHGGAAVCAAAFGKHQLEKVAQAVAEIHQPNELIILKEVDHDND